MKKNIYLMFCFVISLFSIMLAGIGCSKSEKTVMVTSPITTDTVAIPDTTIGADSVLSKFLALGDSYTIGQSVPMQARFPAQTAQLLRNDTLPIGDPQYIATTGWTTSNLMNAINSQTLARNYDIVTLLIGVNDQYQRHDTTGYAAKFESLLLKALEFAGSRKEHVFVLSIPDYSATPFVPQAQKANVSMEIDRFNAINKRVTDNYHIAYLDITPSSRLAANDPSLIATDDLHPSGKEYQVWATLLAPLIRKVLK